MWVSRKRLEDLEYRLASLEGKSNNRFQMSMRLLGELKESLDTRLKDNLFREKEM